MDNVSIGLLLPTSTIFPVSKDFEKGLKEEVKKSPEINVEIVKEFIGQGDIKTTENACVKLFNYDDVDIITGVLSARASHEISDKFKNKQTPLLINNLGAQVPDVKRMNEFIFINSFNIWQHAWSIGYSGVKEFGLKGMFVGAVYDAGYSFSQMFHLGMKAADVNSKWSFSIPPMPNAGELSNMEVIFPFLEKYEPDFVFATFCGEETTLFMNEFVKRGWHKKTRLMGLPYLLAPFAPVNDDLVVETTVLWENNQTVTSEKAFYMLGVQAGQIIAEAAKNATGRNELKNELAKISGLFSLNNGTGSGNQKVAFVKNVIKAGEHTFNVEKKRLVDTYPLEIELINPLTEELSIAWYNPYLCI